MTEICIQNDREVWKTLFDNRKIQKKTDEEGVGWKCGEPIDELPMQIESFWGESVR